MSPVRGGTQRMRSFYNLQSSLAPVLVQFNSEHNYISHNPNHNDADRLTCIIMYTTHTVFCHVGMSSMEHKTN